MTSTTGLKSCRPLGEGLPFTFDEAYAKTRLLVNNRAGVEQNYLEASCLIAYNAQIPAPSFLILYPATATDY